MSMPTFVCLIHRPHRNSYIEKRATEHSHFRTNYLSYQYPLLKIHVIGIWGLWRRYRMRKIMQIPRRRWSTFWRPMVLSYMTCWKNMQKIKQGSSFYHICQGYSLIARSSYIEEFWCVVFISIESSPYWFHHDGGTNLISRIAIQSYSPWILTSYSSTLWYLQPLLYRSLSFHLY